MTSSEQKIAVLYPRIAVGGFLIAALGWFEILPLPEIVGEIGWRLVSFGILMVIYYSKKLYDYSLKTSKDGKPNSDWLVLSRDALCRIESRKASQLPIFGSVVAQFWLSCCSSYFRPFARQFFTLLPNESKLCALN